MKKAIEMKMKVIKKKKRRKIFLEGWMMIFDTN